jgi:sarcosine oxidase delta subunit
MNIECPHCNVEFNSDGIAHTLKKWRIDSSRNQYLYNRIKTFSGFRRHAPGVAAYWGMTEI